MSGKADSHLGGAASASSLSGVLASMSTVSLASSSTTVNQSLTGGAAGGRPHSLIGSKSGVTAPLSQYVKLNVGGSLYYTSVGTLTKHDTMLKAMFSGRMEVLTDSEGWILIDRCGKQFGTILNFLRDGDVCLPETKRELAELQNEAKYFCIPELAEACDKNLQQFVEKDSEILPICRVPLITSQKEEQALIMSNSTKPIVKLLINRHNNKYSYTGASDDNFLKNIELFDKLSLRFSNRVLFIKDVIGSNEICCWSFYGHGKKIAEVCCTAIVYATDRKNTKVDFPEARIYEETLNCLLYENRNGPDPELIWATSKRGPNNGSSSAMAAAQQAAAATGSGNAPCCTSDDDEVTNNGARNFEASGPPPVAQQQPSGNSSSGVSRGISRFARSRNTNKDKDRDNHHHQGGASGGGGGASGGGGAGASLSN